MEALAAEIQHRMENEVAEIKRIENGKSKSTTCMQQCTTYDHELAY